MIMEYATCELYDGENCIVGIVQYVQASYIPV